MSGDMINTSNAIKEQDIFTDGFGGFTGDALTSMFDINQDGVVDGEELSHLESSNLLYALNDISPVEAKAYNDSEFKLRDGRAIAGIVPDDYTDQDRADFIKILNEGLVGLEDIEADGSKVVVIEPRHTYGEYDKVTNHKISENLEEDMKERTYLEKTEFLTSH